MTGTTGEAPTLTDEERFALYEVAVDEVGGTHTVIAGTGTYDTAHSVHLTARAHEIGVDGFLVVTPYYNKPPQRGHRRARGRDRRRDRPPARLLRHPEPRRRRRRAGDDLGAGGDPERHAPSSRRSRRSMRHGTSSPRGSTSTPATTTSSCPFLEVGGVGGICVTTHVVGPQVKEMIDALPRGRPRRRPRDRRGASPRDRPPARADEPDPDQDGAEPARSRGRRLPPAARRCDARGGGRRARLPRAARAAAADCGLTRTEARTRQAEACRLAYPYTAPR